jgi:hypothetical protein
VDVHAGPAGQKLPNARQCWPARLAHTERRIPNGAFRTARDRSIPKILDLPIDAWINKPAEMEQAEHAAA